MTITPEEIATTTLQKIDEHGRLKCLAITTGYFSPPNNRQCARLGRYERNGELYCRQHAEVLDKRAKEPS